MNNRSAGTLAASLLMIAILGTAGCMNAGAAGVSEEQLVELCDGLQSTLPVTQRAAIQDATALFGEADDGSAVLEALEEVCPSALTEALAGQLGGSERESELRADLSLDLEGCVRRAAEGTVTNDGDATVTVSIRAEFIGRDDTLLRESSRRVTIRPGQTGRFSVPFVADGEHYARCHVEIDRVTLQ